MSEPVTIHLIGKNEVFVREIEKFDPDEPQYVNLSPTKREVYHFVASAPGGIPTYELMGFEEKQIPDVRGVQ